MVYLCPEDSKKVAYICHEEEKITINIQTSLILLDHPDLPDDDQEAWSHL